jgi:hypothetical protein
MNLTRTNISLHRNSDGFGTKQNSYARLQDNKTITTLERQQKTKLAELLKFISIAVRESHNNNDSKVKITIDSVKNFLVDELSFPNNDASLQIAKDLISIANIESPKMAGVKEFFLRHHSIPRHIKDFITIILRLNPIFPNF